jgi:hypothetical protein
MNQNESESPELPIEDQAGAVEEIIEPTQEESVPAADPDEISQELALALQQMRTQICALGLCFVIVSVALSLFVWKQNSNLALSIKNRGQQVEQLKGSLELWMPALNELAAYSSANPELRTIFNRHGLQIGQQQPGAGTAAPAQ